MNKKKPDALNFNLEQEDSTGMNLQNGYDVPVVSQGEIRELCDTVGAYLPQRRNSISDLQFWKIAFFEMTGKSPLFWMCCAIFLSVIAVLIQTAMSYFSPLLVMIILAPVPFLAFAIDALHCRDPHVVELETTCRFDIRQLYIAKLLIGMLFNIILMLPAVCAANSVYKKGGRLALCAFTTMFFIGFIALFLIEKAKNSLPLSAFLALWVISGGALLRRSGPEKLLESISMAALTVAFIACLVLFAIKLIYAAQHMRFRSETGGYNL